MLGDIYVNKFFNRTKICVREGIYINKRKKNAKSEY